MLKTVGWSFIAVIFSFCLFGVDVHAQTADVTAAREAQLKANLAQVEAEINQQQNLLAAKQKESASIQRDIDVLTYQINTAKLNIKAKQIEIQQLGSDIGKKEQTIGTLNDQMGKERETLAELLRKTRELDDSSVVEVALANTSMSSLFADVNSFYSLEQSVDQSLGIVKSTKDSTERQKLALEDRQAAEIDAEKAIEAEKAKIEKLNKEKNRLLSISKTQEGAYKTEIASKEKERQKILDALFQLRGSKSITFGQAYDYAKLVSAKTGVRPAFLMAILTQESNLGQNVGTCNRPGDPPSKSWKSVMKPSRDYQPYVQITSALGIDPDTMPVSCPMGGGYGGAMGPAQFIPSTWVLYEHRVSALTGDNPANPWAPKDAFMASGLLLSDLGAADGGYTAERRAALKYYAGGNWAKPANAFYGNEVMGIASTYQDQIDTLQND